MCSQVVGPGLDLETTDFMRARMAESHPGLCSRLLMLVVSQQITTYRTRCQIQPVVVYAGQPVVPSSCPKLAADGAAEPTIAGMGLWDSENQ